MTIHKKDLIPYKSYIIFKNTRSIGDISQNLINESFSKIIDSSFEYEVDDVSNSRNTIESVTCFQRVIKVTTEVPWLGGAAVVNHVNTNYILILISFYDGWTLINVSENSLSNKLHTFFSGTSSHEDPDYKIISKFIRLADSSFIESLLPKNSIINTFWLSGTHKSTILKADSKSLAGQDLEQALDPQEDQTFHYTSARYTNTIDGNIQKSGISPSKSKVWFSRSKDMIDFILTGKKITDILNNPGETKDLKILSKPTNNYDNLGSPADIVFFADFIMPDNLNDESDFLETIHVEFNLISRPRLSLWDQSITSWEIKKYITIDLFYLGEKICDFNIQIGFENGKNPLIKIKDINFSDSFDDKETIKGILRTSNLKIWFDSNHTLSQKQIYENQYKDVNFDFNSHAIYKNFGISTSLIKEKPNLNGAYNPNDIGNDDSLFCWLKNNNIPELNFTPSEGTLICDDGAGEISDFIYINNNLLILFHIKAAQTIGPRRTIANGAFEVVCSQAIKNIKHGDITNIEERLLSRNQSSRKIWVNGMPNTINNALDNYNRGQITNKTVVILQPHLLQNRVLSLENRTYNQTLLETLLVSVSRNCMANGINFKVIGSTI